MVLFVCVLNDNLTKEVVQELTRDTRDTEAEVTLVKEASREREVIRVIARTVEKITKSPNL